MLTWEARSELSLNSMKPISVPCQLSRRYQRVLLRCNKAKLDIVLHLYSTKRYLMFCFDTSSARAIWWLSCAEYAIYKETNY